MHPLIGPMMDSSSLELIVGLNIRTSCSTSRLRSPSFEPLLRYFQAILTSAAVYWCLVLALRLERSELLLCSITAAAAWLLCSALAQDVLSSDAVLPCCTGTCSQAQDVESMPEEVHEVLQVAKVAFKIYFALAPAAV